MKEFLTSARKTLVYYWLAYVYVFLFSLNSLSTAMIASLINTQWGSLNSTDKFLIVLAVVSNWTGTMLALVNKTLHRLQEGKSLIESGNTEIITK